jgi:hypothetical protein
MSWQRNLLRHEKGGYQKVSGTAKAPARLRLQLNSKPIYIPPKLTTSYLKNSRLRLRTRQKPTQKRSIRVVCEHFKEAFNAVIEC